jgi:exonuclease III
VYPGINGFTYESQDPTVRIDYVWVNQALVDKIIDIEIVSGVSNQLGNGLSDHFGLLATFDL